MNERDPWTPYESHPGKGKGKGGDHDHPVIPEPSVYGAVFALIVTLIYLKRKFDKKHE